MSSNVRTLLAFFSVIFGLLFLIAGLSQDWPTWSWGLLAGTLMSTVLAASGIPVAQGDDGRLGSAPEPTVPNTGTPPGEPFVPTSVTFERRIENVPLPSRHPDYDFLFSATVRWHPGEHPVGQAAVDPGGLAADAVVTRARRFSAGEQPSRHELLRHHLAGALATPEPDATHQIMATAHNVAVTLQEADAERLDRLGQVRKDEAIWLRERNHERSKRAYLGNDVLKDPGSAVVWWLANHTEEVRGTVDLIGLLAQLSAAANNGDVPETFQHFVTAATGGGTGDECMPPDDLTEPEQNVADAVAVALEKAGLGPDAPERTLLIDRWAEAMDHAGRAGAAEEIRRRFAPRSFPPDPSEDDAG